MPFLPPNQQRQSTEGLTQKTCHIFDMFFSYLHCPQSMWSSVYVTAGRPFVCPIRPPLAVVVGFCCGPGGQEISIHYCTAGAQQQPQRSGVRQRDVGNATLSADVGSSTLKGGKMLCPRR